MKLLGTVSALAILGMAAPVLALDIGGGFTLSGNLEYERVSVESTDLGIGLLDGDVSYQHSSGFGAFFGTEAISYSGSSAEAFYGALSYSGNFGKIQIGAPRSALNDYVDAPAIGGVDFFDFQLAPFTGSYLPVVLLGSDETAYGLRYDGTFGAASVGVSVHDIEGATVVDAGMNYALGQTKLMAGIENVNGGGGSSVSSYFLGAEHDFGQVTAGAILGNSELVGDAQTVQAYAIYSPTDRLDLTASLLHVDISGTSGDLYGVDANFDLSETVYVEAGYLGGDLFGSSADIYSVSLGVNF